MAQDTLLGFPAHTLPFRRGEFTTLLTAWSEAAHCAASAFYFRTRDGWYPLFALVGRCVRFWKRRRGVAPLG